MTDQNWLVEITMYRLPRRYAASCSACARSGSSNTSYPYCVRVTQKGQVTIPQRIREALGIRAGSEVRFELEGDAARLVPARDDTAEAIDRMRGAGDVDLTTDEILALTRT